VTQPILAYLDPGSTATILQLTIAGTAGIAAVAKLKWHRIKSLFSSRTDAVDETEEATERVS
jgi:hypothetical protein